MSLKLLASFHHLVALPGDGPLILLLLGGNADLDQCFIIASQKAVQPAGNRSGISFVGVDPLATLIELLRNTSPPAPLPGASAAVPG